MYWRADCCVSGLAKHLKCKSMFQMKQGLSYLEHILSNHYLISHAVAYLSEIK